MKKIILLVVTTVMVLTMFVGCNSEVKITEKVDVNIACMSGPTGMGMTKFMSDVGKGENFNNNYNFSLIVAPDEVTAGLVKGDLDIAALPANLASVLYNNTDGGVQTIAINTLGVIYILENGDTLTDVESLRGKTIISAGKGGTPEMALRYVLSENGIDPDKDVTIEWKSEQSECLAYLASNPGAIAMMPEPFVTTAKLKNENIKVKIDISQEWDKTQKDAENPSNFITGVVVARSEFVKENPEVIADFLENYEKSVDYTNTNIEEAATLIGEYKIAPYETAVAAIPNCNIVCIVGDEMKTSLEGYLKVLFDQNPKSIGGALPQSEFYYAK